MPGQLMLSEPGYLSADPSELYVWVPDESSATGGKYVREDYFDQYSDLEYSQIMDALDEYNGVSGKFLDRFRENRDNRRSKRNARKDLKNSSKATARTQRSAGGGFFNRALDTVRDTFGGQNSPQIDGGIDFQTGQSPTGFFKAETPTNYTPYYIGGAIIVIGGILYFATKSK